MSDLEISYITQSCRRCPEASRVVTAVLANSPSTTSAGQKSSERKQIVETIYGGFPAALTGIAAAREVFKNPWANRDTADDE